MGVVVGGRGRCRLQGWGVAGRVHYSLAPAILRPVGGEEKIAKHWPKQITHPTKDVRTNVKI